MEPKRRLEFEESNEVGNTRYVGTMPELMKGIVLVC